MNLPSPFFYRIVQTPSNAFPPYAPSDAPYLYTTSALGGMLSGSPTNATINEDSLHESTESLLAMVLDLQTKLIQLQAGGTPSTTSSELLSDAFTDVDGVNNSVITSKTTAAYSSPSYKAASISYDPSTYEPNAYVTWVLIKTYTNINALVKSVSSELQLDTQSYLIFTYDDLTTHQTATQTGSGDTSWATRTFTHANESKTVSSIAVWGRKPSSLANNNAHVRNVSIIKHMTVEVVIDLSSFSSPITAAELFVDASRQSGDAISYALSNSSTTNAGLALSLKNTLPTPLSAPARLHIELTPAQIQDFVLGATSLKAFTIRLW